jgi:hypothetical protein
MIFFRDKEKQRLKELEKQKEKEQKEEQKRLEEFNKRQAEQQKQQKELEKKEPDEIDFAKLSPTSIATDEQILYRWNITKGTFRTRVITSYFVTNYRIVTVFQLENNPQIMLENISDVVAINTHREYEGGYRGTTVGSKGLRYTVGGQRGKSVSYGDIIISSPTEQDHTWYKIRDYNSVIRLIKSLRKTRIEKIKQQHQ